MNYSKAIVIDIIAYIATMLIGSGISFSFGIKLDPAVAPSQGFISMSMILTLVLTGLGAAYYFRSNTVKKGTMQGILFGVVAILVGLAMDGVLFLMLLVSGVDPRVFFAAMYSNVWLFSTMLLLTLVATAIIGEKSKNAAVPDAQLPNIDI